MSDPPNYRPIPGMAAAFSKEAGAIADRILRHFEGQTEQALVALRKNGWRADRLEQQDVEDTLERRVTERRLMDGPWVRALVVMTIDYKAGRTDVDVELHDPRSDGLIDWVADRAERLREREAP